MPVLRGHDLVYAYIQIYFHKLVSSERDLLYINLLLSPLTWGRMCEVNGLWASGLAASTFTGGAISLAHIDFVFTCRASNAGRQTRRQTCSLLCPQVEEQLTHLQKKRKCMEDELDRHSEDQTDTKKTLK